MIYQAPPLDSSIPAASPISSAVAGVPLPLPSLSGVAVVAAGGAGAASGPVPPPLVVDSLPRSVALHPLSNTGCITPLPAPTPTLFHLDYLALTLKAATCNGVDREQVAELVMWLLSEKLWPRFSDQELSEWIDRGAGRHWGKLWQLLPGVTVRVPSCPDEQYVSVEFKGEAFCWLGQDDVLELIAWLGRSMAEGIITSVKATRVDLAFDHVAITPAEMREWIDAGSTRSRAFARCKGGVPDVAWLTNGEGQTCSLKAGPRLLRLYNRRGYNRLELELRDQHAVECFADLVDLPSENWASHAIGRLRGFVDFVDRDSSERLDRCRLLSRWADLVCNVSPERLRPRERVESTATPAGKFNVKGVRMKKTLAQLLHALGPEDFARYCTNLAKSGVPDLTPSEKIEAEALRSWTFFLDHYKFADEPDDAPPPF